MDDLTFRRTVYADPFTTDPDVIKAASTDPKKQSFWQEIKSMETELQNAMNIPVPENLAERLILRQSLTQHTEVKKQRPWYLAIAASAVLATILTVGMLNSGSGKFQNDVFAHMDHVSIELMKSAEIDIDGVNTKLASFNGAVNQDIGEVVSANFCYLDKIKSLHMIIRGENGLTSLFVVPDAMAENLDSNFSNASFEGASFLLESAKIIVVGSNKSDVTTLQNRALAAFSFSA